MSDFLIKFYKVVLILRVWESACFVSQPDEDQRKTVYRQQDGCELRRRPWLTLCCMPDKLGGSKCFLSRHTEQPVGTSVAIERVG